MEQLSYSFHLGSNKNKKSSIRSKAKNNRSNSTSLANNGIQNYQQLSKVNNHDFRKYDNNTKDIYTLKGINDVVYDVQNFYKKEFEEARLEYNNKQSRPSRRIDDYFTYVSNDEKRDLACEIIVELGNKEFWDTKDLDYKRKMVEVYNNNLKYLEELVPEFKVTNAVVHLDETSPHMHIVGIPIKENCKTGLSKQVNKSFVFTKDRLEIIQDKMRKNCIKEFNNIYQLNYSLKTKEKGRNKDINVKDMINYNEIKLELENNKNILDKNNKMIKEFKETSNEMINALKKLNEDESGNIKLTNNQKNRLLKLINDTNSLSNHFDELSDSYNNIALVTDNLKYQKERNKEVSNKYDDVLKEYKNMEKEFKDLSESEQSLKQILNLRKDDHYRLVTYLCKYTNSDDYYTSQTFKQLTESLYENKIIDDKEKYIIFNPPKIISKYEINNALSNINKEMEEAAEEFYRIN